MIKDILRAIGASLCPVMMVVAGALIQHDACIVNAETPADAESVTSEDAIAYLRDRSGIRVSVLQSYKSGPHASSVTLRPSWKVAPIDWYYIGCSAGRIKFSGSRHPISVSVNGKLTEKELLPCFKQLLKSKPDVISFDLSNLVLTRGILRALAAFPKLRGTLFNYYDSSITDDDWAYCISKWPSALKLYLGPSAGPKAIEAASQLKHIDLLCFRNQKIDAEMLEPLRKCASLRHLCVWDDNSPNGLKNYLNHKGAGVWQLEHRPKAIDP